MVGLKHLLLCELAEAAKYYFASTTATCMTGLVHMVYVIVTAGHVLSQAKQVQFQLHVVKTGRGRSVMSSSSSSIGAPNFNWALIAARKTILCLGS